MKVKFLSLATIVAFFMASCGGVDKGLVDSITKFETDWTSMMKDVSSASEKMTSEAAETSKACDEMAMKECKDKKMMGMADSLKMACNTSKEGMSSTVTNINTMKEDLAKVTTAFNEWKEKVMKGEVKGEEATKALTEYQNTMTQKKEDLKSLMDAFERAKGECMSQCDGLKECCEK